jgi:protein-tyrosine phosphatase
MMPDDMSIVEKKVSHLQHALDENGINVEIVKGAEVHITHNLIEEIRENRNDLVLNGSSYMLLEFPAGHIIAGVKEFLFEVMSEGICPIIAHPERNYVFMRNADLLYELVGMGALTQANSGSFTGLYGRRVKEAAFRFLGLKLTHFIGSDAHNPRPSAMWLSEAVKRAEEGMGNGDISTLVNDNPHAILEDRELLDLPQPIDPKEIEKSFRIKIPRLFRR